MRGNQRKFQVLTTYYVLETHVLFYSNIIIMTRPPYFAIFLISEKEKEKIKSPHDIYVSFDNASTVVENIILETVMRGLESEMQLQLGAGLTKEN